MTTSAKDAIITVTPAALETSIEGLHGSLAEYIQASGLPTKDVLVPVEERRYVLRNLQQALGMLAIEERARAQYLSKFTIAICAGLFDAALNYLWNETVKALRELVSATDLSYFFDIVEKRENHRAKLNSAEDLPRIEEAQLIE